MMAIADILSSVKNGIENAGKAAVPALQRTAEVISGEAPQIDAEKRNQQYALEDAEINTKAKLLEDQLAIGQKYGTLTPQQQQQYVDSITGLYSHPRHAGTLMEKLRKATAPQGMYAGGGLPSATPEGGTFALEQTAKQAEEKRKLADALTMIEARENAKAANEKDKPPKGMKAMEAPGGVFLGVTDQDTGKQYMADQLGPGGDAPPEAKKMYEAIQKAQADKEKKEADKQKEQSEKESRRFGQQLQMQVIGMQKALEVGDYREARKEVTKATEALDNSVDRANTMDKSLKEALAGNQQAMVNLLANHVAMTKQQVGTSMRPARADYVEAAASLPEFDKLVKQFDENHGLLSGITLSPDQMRQMTDLAHEKVDTLKEHVDRVKQEYGDALTPAPLTGAKGVGKVLKGGTGANPVTPTAAQPKVLKYNQATGQLE